MTNKKKPISSQLNLKQNMFVAEVIKTGSKSKAYQKVYKPKTNNMNSIHRQAHQVSSNHLVKQAIADALETHQMTPEYAIKQLKKVVDQDDELGAKRLAIKDVLELHGWQRGDRPTVVLDVQNAFFSSTRDTTTRLATDSGDSTE